MRFAAIFSLVVGAGMFSQWALSYFSKQIPELETEPVRIWFHIAAELATAGMLVAGGLGLLASRPWGNTVYLLATGMLFYTAIVSPGYFAQKGQRGWVVLFAAVILFALIGLFQVFDSRLR